ncbi:putative pterin-4-alpha-carbinolamine dehydratase [Kribbella flavida DSM 17836]|uniref:Putative pterin-4-alpha-carbinolamine dehydratase n=1 Tax=Kribbella flavida (strain DSM 17836 / JCM 10339 / NBRC 14399) TaxID=479435 RepID=D2PN66_KRIFD|nr:4a-hydroxytetrahydrobiopterin dehydratase [Kribbella flavida]ADB34550.1 putative pterin-4-alpha-carbinolamine dehydratase [Kribbella flavida DSM 17836]
MAELLTDDQIDAAIRDHLPAWKVAENALVRSVETPTFLDGIRLVATVAQLAESMNHHPDIDIRYTTITFRVSSHEAGGITNDDLVLARHIDTAAA